MTKLSTILCLLFSFIVAIYAVAPMEDLWWLGASGEVCIPAAYQTDGIDDGLYVSDHDDFSFLHDGGNVGAFTVAAWGASFGGDTLYMFSKYDAFGPDRREYALYVSAAGKPTAYYWTNSIDGWDLQESQDTVTLSDWNHFAWAHPGGNGGQNTKLYINGAEVSGYDFSAGIPGFAGFQNTSHRIDIGHIEGGSGYVYTENHVADLRVYTNQLSATTISNLYFNGIEPEESPLAHWLMAGGTLLDDSGNGHHLSTVGAPTWSDAPEDLPDCAPR